MGIGTLGFLSGASKTALSGLQARDEEDRQKRRDELLAKLQMENAVKLKAVDHAYDVEDEKRKITTWVQSGDGEYVGLNALGEEKTKRKMTPAELKAAQDKAREVELELESKRLGNANTSDMIRSRGADDRRQDLNSAASRAASAASAEADRARAKSYGLDSGGGSEKDASSLDEARARQMVTEYDKTLSSALANAQGITRAEVEQVALGIMQSSRTGDEARRRFRSYLTELSIRSPRPKGLDAN